MKARRSKAAEAITKPATASAPAVTAAVVTASALALGRLAPGSTVHSLLLQLDGRPPVAARTTLVLDEAAIKAAVAGRQPALALFENGDPERPIIVGLVQPDQGAALLGSLLAQPVKAAPASAVEPARAPVRSSEASRAPVVARVDGKRVVIEGRDEVTLKCGDASITLMRDGKMILRGTYVETTSRGVNRIRGGSVKIN